MPDTVMSPEHPPSELENSTALSPTTPPIVGVEQHAIAGTSGVAPLAALPSALPQEAQMMLELIGQGLAPDADESMRAAARDLWARFAQSLAAATVPPPPAAPGMPTAPSSLAAPETPAAPGTPPAAMPPAAMLPAAMSRAAMLPAPTPAAMPPAATPLATMPPAAMPPAAMPPAAMPLAAMPLMPDTPAMPLATMPLMPAIPAMAVAASPIAAAARALRQLPPEQLLELALQRLRAALPAGATVPTPKGIQFPLVPVAPLGAPQR
jgi:hypothetical protein